MKKLLTFAFALIASASLMAKDVTCTNLYRYVYTDYATGNPYYSVQFGDEDWNSYYFAFKGAGGPLVGTTYTMDDMIAEQTYASINYKQDPITTVSLQRNYEGLQEQFAISVTTESGEQYNLTWAAAGIPTKVEPVDLDTTIVCDFADNKTYKTFTPLERDYNYYDFTIAIAGDLPTVNQQKKYTWKANTVYIGNANFSLPNDGNTKPFDATFTINGVEGGYEGIAEYSMTNGKKYTFNFKYTIPVAKETVYLSGYDLKIQTNWDKTVSFSWQNDTYSAQLPINSTDTLGNWKGNDIILSNCSFYRNPYINLGVYAIDSIYVTRTEEGYIRLQTSILCKNNTLYVLDVTNQESPYYVKYDTDGTGVKWQNIPASQYGTGRTMGIRYNNDSIWFNAAPKDEGAAGYSIKETYGTYGDPLWAKDSITISYDPNTSWGSPLSVYMAEKYYDAELNVELSSRSYENVEGDGVWNYSFTCGSYMEGNHYSFNFGIYGPITAPAQYKTYTLGNMTEDYRTKGYDPEYNEIKYDVVTLYRELVWPANDAEKITINVHTTDGKAYKLIYAADTIPTATDTIKFVTKSDFRQQEYWYQFSGEGATDDAQYRVQLSLAGEQFEPNTYYWKLNDIYKPGTIIYNNTTGQYVDIADALVQTDVITAGDSLLGYMCQAYFLGYDKHCYFTIMYYMIPVAEDTVTIECKDLIISNYGQNNINYGAFNNEYQVNINIATADTFGIFRDEVDPSNCSVGLNYTPFTSAQGYSVDSIEITKDENGIIHLTAGILCKNNVYYSIHLTTEVTPYYLGVANEEGIVEWFDMVQGFYSDGRASGAWDIDAVVYNDDKVFVNTVKEADGNELTFPFETMSKADGIVIEKYDTVSFQYNVYYKEVFAVGIKKYVDPTGLNNARYNQTPAIKRFENGNVVIERNGRKYNVLGF